MELVFSTPVIVFAEIAVSVNGKVSFPSGNLSSLIINEHSPDILPALIELTTEVDAKSLDASDGS